MANPATSAIIAAGLNPGDKAIGAARHSMVQRPDVDRSPPQHQPIGEQDAGRRCKNGSVKGDKGIEPCIQVIARKQQDQRRRNAQHRDICRQS